MPIAEGKARLLATVDQEVADQVKALAAGMDTSVAKLLGTLITIAIRSAGGTFETYAGELARLKGEAEE